MPLYFDVEVTILDGDSGLPVVGAKVTVAWAKPPAGLVSANTDALGKVLIADEVPRSISRYFIGVDKKDYTKCIVEAELWVTGTTHYTRPRKIYIYKK